MNKLKKFFTSIPGIILVFVLAALPLVFGGIGSARAALTYYSDTYSSRVSMRNIGVQLNENGNPVSMRTFDENTANGLVWNESTGQLLSFMNNDGFELQLGEKYNEVLTATNTGEIDQFVRVTVYKYWLDGKDEIVKSKDIQKCHSISPELIKVKYTNVDNGIWIEDQSAKTLERQVFYYHKVLPKGATTEALTESVSISPDITDYVNVTENSTTVVDPDGSKHIYKEFYYDHDYTFVIRADVDAVQTHNAYPAIKSAWGVNVDENQIKNGNFVLR